MAKHVKKLDSLDKFCSLTGWNRTTLFEKGTPSSKKELLKKAKELKAVEWLKADLVGYFLFS